MLRSELFSIEQLKRHAIKLAGEHKLDPHPGADKLLPRLADNERVLLAAYQVVTSAAIPGNRLIAAEAWLLDNFYLIEQQILQARRHLPHGYSKQLPRLATGISAGFPRIYDLALALISHMDGRVDSDNATHIVAAYQSLAPLKLGELWAFPIMLQLALLENLRRVALRIARRREERDAAILWADRMLVTAEKEPKKLIQLLAEFANADIPLTAPFVEEFYERLQAQGSVMAFVQSWVEQKLLEQGVTATQLSEIAGRTAAANQISIANSIGSLRFIGNMDWRNYVESLSVVEKSLHEDPAEMYAAQDFSTRDRYRHVVEEMARTGFCTEIKVAKEAILLAKMAAALLGIEDRTAHVGYYFMDRGRQQLELILACRLPWHLRFGRICKHWRLKLYLFPILLLTTGFSMFVAQSFLRLGLSHFSLALIVLPLLIAASALSTSLVNLMVAQILPPRALPRLDFSKGIPDLFRCMVIVPTLINESADVDRLLEALEIRYLGNRDTNLYFALLTDFDDAEEQTLPRDEPLLLSARAAVEALNLKYRGDRPSIFYLFHRPRLWNAYEQVWMGYERKRGKLEQFNALLREDIKSVEKKSGFSEIVGDIAILPSIKYVITLDTDTQLPRDSARTLVGNMAHPLNRPVYDPVVGRVVDGYTILQPRASISLHSAEQSWFTKLYAGESGIDPYTREISDVYQDIFGEGSFIGKGIYDVDVFHQVLDGRFPENLVLSHDLLESGYARSALVTDVDLIEEFPASYMMEISRRHRWIRGDWQLAGWLLPQVPQPNMRQSIVSQSNLSKPTSGSFASPKFNPLSALSIWKIFDNLRRSLVGPSLLTLLLASWLFGIAYSLIAILLVTVVVFLPVTLGVVIDVISKPKERDWLLHLNMSAKSAAHPFTLGVLTIMFLPYEAIICLSAILASGVRMILTKRGLLLWQLPSYAVRNRCRSLNDFIRAMWIAPVLAILTGVVVVCQHLLVRTSFADLLASSAVLLLWLGSPVVAWWISQPIISKPLDLTAAQRAFLRASARRTWRFFSQFVSAEEQWLPPDNFQEYPAPVIASRTSPTNIGMSLLANLAAHDFGYISGSELLRLTENTLASMEKLERYRGHFYNWYDTRTLQPLRPQYISSVDSGNLMGSLLTLQMGLAALKDQPVMSCNAFQGLQDTLQVLSEHILHSDATELLKKIAFLQATLEDLIPPVSGDPRPKRTLMTAISLLEEIQRQGHGLLSWLTQDIEDDSELAYWVAAFNQQAGLLLDDLRLLSPASNTLSDIPTLTQLLEVRATIPESDGHSLPCYQAALARLNTINQLEARCLAISTMDFEFLYDTSSDLISIGYDVGERRRDPSCYDLLASEARLASFLLIAQGHVPQKHWFSLGRLLTSHGGDVSLISWSGSMFEYLMPQLIMASYSNTLLDEQSCMHQSV